MARISDVELERLKRETSLQRLCEAKGVVLQKRGVDEFVGRCPFHDDKTPSFTVSTKKNLWHCLGACRAGGSVIDFVMRAESVSFLHAVELLRNNAPLSPTLPAAKRSSTPKLPAPVKTESSDAEALRDVVAHYHQTLLQSEEALEYLTKRGLRDDALIRHFQLGYANRGLGLRLPRATTQDGAVVRERLQRLGVMRVTGHEHLSGTVVVPLVDETGEVKGMYGRKVSPDTKPHQPKHLYLPGPHRVVFNESGLAGRETVILCEAVIDALSFWAAGFRAVTSAYGVEGFTAAHLDAFKRHGVKGVMIAFDRDDAGDAAAEAVAKQLFAAGFKCWRVQFPRGMDANEYACKVQPATKSLGVVLRQAQWMGADGEAQPAPAVHFEKKTPSPSAAQLPVRDVMKAAVAVQEGSEGKREVQRPSVAARIVELPAVSFRATDVAHAADAAASSVTAASSNTAASSITAAQPLETSSTAEETPPDADEAQLSYGPRKYRVRGLSKKHSSESLRLNILLSINETFHVDSFDLYSAKARAAFVQQASVECGLDADTVKRDVGQLLLHVETLEEKRREARVPKARVLSQEETEAALSLLKTPNLLQQILTDFARCGVVGEETNKLVGYLAATSRKLEEPLAVLIQSSSAAGKSSLMEAVLAFVPEEEKTKYSAMTGQSLFYMGDSNLKHKVLAVVEEEGASKASYALKLLQSEGELTIASTGKDPHTGKLVTHEYHVEGPTQLFLTTTASELDDELLNRCLVLTVDEEQPQTENIHRLQREKRTLEGRFSKKEKSEVLKLHQDAQRMLRPLTVVNPYARSLTFPASRTRTRRDFPKYLTLIDSIALLHQYQRETKTAQKGSNTVEYVEVTRSDIETANRLAASVLGRTLDELPPQTRRLLEQLETYVAAKAATAKQLKSEVTFSRREVRTALGWGDTQLHVHLSRLQRLEYLVPQRGARGGLAYQLRLDGEVAGAQGLAGLTDVASLSSRPPQNSGPSTQDSGAFGQDSAPTPECGCVGNDEGFESNSAGFGVGANSHMAEKVTAASTAATAAEA